MTLELRVGIEIMAYVLLRQKLRGMKAYQKGPHSRSDAAPKFEGREGGSPGRWGGPDRSATEGREW